MVPKNRVSLLVGRCLRRHLRASPWNGDLLNASLRHPLKRLPAEVNATSFDASETVGTQAGFLTDGVAPYHPFACLTRAASNITRAPATDAFKESSLP